MNEQEYKAARAEILRQLGEEASAIPDDDVIPRTFNDALYNEPYRKLQRKYVPMLLALEEEYRNGSS